MSAATPPSCTAGSRQVRPRCRVETAVVRCAMRRLPANASCAALPLAPGPPGPPALHASLRRPRTPTLAPSHVGAVPSHIVAALPVCVRAAMIDETTGGLVFELKKAGELGPGSAFTVRLEVRGPRFGSGGVGCPAAGSCSRAPGSPRCPARCGSGCGCRPLAAPPTSSATTHRVGAVSPRPSLPGRLTTSGQCRPALTWCAARAWSRLRAARCGLPCSALLCWCMLPPPAPWVACGSMRTPEPAACTCASEGRAGLVLSRLAR